MKKWMVLLLFFVILLVTVPSIIAPSTCFYYYNLDTGRQDIRTSQHTLPSCNGCWAAHGVWGQLKQVDCTAIQQGRVVYVNGGPTTPDPPYVPPDNQANLPYADSTYVYNWMKDCLYKEYNAIRDVDQAIDNCRFDYDNKVSNYDLWFVASCYEDCSRKRYTNCNAYCVAVRQKLKVMENKQPAEDAITAWIDFWVSAGQYVRVPKSTCSDGKMNQGEAGIDCGGPCKACSDIIEKTNGCFRVSTGKQVTCPRLVPACYNMLGNIVECVEGITYACSDPITRKNIDCPADEIDVTKDGCFYKKVRVNCPGEKKATCYDGIKNQGETKTDCGGPCQECDSIATCSDNVKNQDETGIDCGGFCEPCVSCSDGIKNQDEEDVDCGGSCNTCPEEPSCDDNVRNQDEEGIDCGGKCKACFRVITFNDLSEKDKDELAKMHFRLLYHQKKGNRDEALKFESQILEFWKKVSEKMGADPSQFDIMNHFVQLQADQTSMSDYEKKDRRKTAQLAYASLLGDEYRFKKGIGDAQDISDKKEEIKAQYGRILFFDADDVQANKAMGDIYRKEGDEDAAKFFHRAAMKSAAKNDPASYNELKKIVATYKKEASDDLNLPEPPNTVTSKIIHHISEKSKKYIDKADLAIYQQQQDIEIWLESATFVEERKVLWEKFNEFLFSFSPEQIEKLGGVESE